MSEKMSTGMEKVYFLKILSDPSQFSKVEPYYFKNDDLQFIYTIVRNEYLLSTKKIVPSNDQILAMVRFNDADKKIPDSLVRLLLKSDNNEYSDEWLDPRFKAWKISNLVKNNVMKSIEYVRSIDEVNYDNVMDIANKIKNINSEVNLVSDDDDDLGEDFDDPESHKINTSNKKLATGWTTMDTLLGGGWDQASLIVLMAQTSGGKSMWMQNIAVQAADKGYNVAYISLEMGSQKCMKRMGSMRMKIPINDYDEKAKDTIFMKNRINQLKNMGGGGMFTSNNGKIFVKKYNTSECTITDIDNYIHKLEETKKIKINYIFVDYLSLMGIEKGLDFKNMLFLKGKHFSEGLRYIADKYNCAVFTGVQTDKAVWSANDIELQNIPESKAIAECCDVCFGIIRNPEMQKHNVYRLKILKFRDGEHHNQEIRFTFNTEFLTMENDEFVNA